MPPLPPLEVAQLVVSEKSASVVAPRQYRPAWAYSDTAAKAKDTASFAVMDEVILAGIVQPSFSAMIILNAKCLINRPKERVCENSPLAPAPSGPADSHARRLVGELAEQPFAAEDVDFVIESDPDLSALLVDLVDLVVAHRRRHLRGLGLERVLKRLQDGLVELRVADDRIAPAVERRKLSVTSAAPGLVGVVDETAANCRDFGRLHVEDETSPARRFVDALRTAPRT